MIDPRYTLVDYIRWRGNLSFDIITITAGNDHLYKMTGQQKDVSFC